MIRIPPSLSVRGASSGARGVNPDASGGGGAARGGAGVRALAGRRRGGDLPLHGPAAAPLAGHTRLHPPHPPRRRPRHQRAPGHPSDGRVARAADSAGRARLCRAAAGLNCVGLAGTGRGATAAVQANADYLAAADSCAGDSCGRGRDTGADTRGTDSCAGIDFSRQQRRRCWRKMVKDSDTLEAVGVERRGGGRARNCADGYALDSGLGGLSSIAALQWSKTTFSETQLVKDSDTWEAVGVERRGGGRARDYEDGYALG